MIGKQSIGRYIIPIRPSLRNKLEHLEQRRRRRRRQVHTKELVPSESSPAFAVRSLPAPPAAPLLFCNQAILAKAKLSPGEQKQGTEKAPCPTDEQERYPTYPGPRSITHQPHAAHTYRVAKLIERGRSRLDKITSHVRRLSSRHIHLPLEGERESPVLA